jgi:hypothetical protein
MSLSISMVNHVGRHGAFNSTEKATPAGVRHARAKNGSLGNFGVGG